ncbi:MAG: Coenzyme F420 hydrogenase/dehydrogenase, beta subunit C-terminal domain [Pleomorphochaeta sp.]
MKAKSIETINEFCTGCGACEVICPKHAIKMALNKDGFLIPLLDHEKCVNCGICLKKCPARSIYDKIKIENGYYYYLDDYKKLIKSSSGGLGTALAEKVVEEGGIVYGVSYGNDYRRIEYCRIEDKNELIRIVGSKYSESDVIDYRALLNDLETGRRVLVFGLPCLIAGVKAVVGNNVQNLILIELMCLGKSPIILYEKFIKELEKKYDSKVKNVNMRYKKKNWIVSWLKVDFESGKTYQDTLSSEPFGKLSHVVFRPSCYTCNFKIKNAPGDIVIGDFWGAEFLDKNMQNKYGMSAALIMNKKGQQLLKDLPGTLGLVDKKLILKTNGAISNSCVKPINYLKLVKLINSDVPLVNIFNEEYGKIKIIMWKMRFRVKTFLPVNVINIIKRFIHR